MLAARSRVATAAAVKLGNFARQVVFHRVLTTIYLSVNGEGWLLSQLGPAIRSFIDVGANVGDWTAAVLAAAPGASGILVEPSANAFATLKQRYEHDGRVALTFAAAGAANGEAEFFEEPNAGQSSSLVQASTNGPVEKRRVAIRALDDLVSARAWSHVDVLKVDCEGYDYFVLKGAESLIRAGAIGVIQFEYNTSWRYAGGTLEATRRLLGDAGYRLFLLRPDGLYEGWEKFGEFYQYSNFVAISPQRLPQLGHLVRGKI